MNLLSGSTWKGAKLRLGEAKPDFKERSAKMTVIVFKLDTNRNLPSGSLSKMHQTIPQRKNADAWVVSMPKI
jgi:hypothetical protein